MEIIDNRAVAWRVRNPQQITAAIPKSTVLSDGRVLVKWGLDEMQTAKDLGVKNVPSPILRDYHWPGYFTPFAHQRETAAFLTLHKRAFCFSEMGTCKTASAAWAADYLMSQGKIRRALIICPVSIMDSAWRADLFRTAMHRTVDIAYGTKEKRRKILDSGAEFVIINYDGVDIVGDELAAGGFDLIIADEANALKNAQTKRWKSVNRLVTADTWVWLMTGTPAAQSPVDAYGLAKIVEPKSVPRFFSAFRDKVMIKVSQFRWLPRPDAGNIVHEVLQPAIRHTKAECLDLPEMTYVRRKVPLTTQQQKYYDTMRLRFIIEAAGEQVTSVNAAVKLNKLLQISAGAVYADSGDTLEFDINQRYNVLREVIEESSQKVLVFVPFRHAIELVARKLNADGVPSEIIDGSVPAGTRTDIFNRFQQADSNPRVLVIQPQAAAHGVTLTAANTVVWWGPTPSLEIFSQANARVHRQGQRHPCTVIQLEGSDAERHLYSALADKIDVHSKIIDMYQKILE